MLAGREITFTSDFPTSSDTLLLSTTVSCSSDKSVEELGVVCCWSGCDDEEAGGEVVSEDRVRPKAEKLGSDAIIGG